MTSPEEVDVDRRLRRLAGVEPRAASTARAVSRTRAALAAAPAPVPDTPPTRRTMMLLKIAAGILLVLGLSRAITLEGPAPASGPAFGQVQDKLKKARTISCVQIDRGQGRPDQTIRLFVREDGILRAEQVGGGYTVTDAARRKVLLVNPERRTATLMEGLAPRLAPDFFRLLRTAHEKAVRRLPEQKVDGRPAAGFVIRVGEGERREDMTVWVDPKTRLPFRFEASGEDEKGRPVRYLLTDFRYDEPLADHLFGLAPPPGYVLTRQGLAELPPPTDIKILQAPEVKPGVGLGPVKFGMTKQQAIEALGKPDKEEQRGMALEYYSRGYGILVGPVRGVQMIHCFTQVTFAIKVRDFQGKTTEGIGMGSRRADVEKAYGKPDEARMNGPQTTYLEYRKRGLHFTLFNDKVVQLTLSPVR